MSVTPERATATTWFGTSRRLAALEHFGVPTEVVGPGAGAPNRVEWLQPSAGGPALLWPGRTALGQAGQAVAAEICLRDTASLCQRDTAPTPLFARFLHDYDALSLLGDYGGTWARSEMRVKAGGDHLASIWCAQDGSVFLPFDPDEVRFNYLSEGYRTVSQAGGSERRRRALSAYYHARGAIPRSVQIWLRRRYAPIQARSTFPHWPVETGLHEFLEFLLQEVASLAGEPVPVIAPWPGEARWALVLTHDVETAAGLAALDPVLELERSLGLRSSWNFVPRRDYELSIERARALQREGFEIGVHGLHHDGRDLESRETMEERLPGMRRAAADWNASGFRSPATRRRWDLMPLLGFDYDSSYPDTDPFEPQGGGCCTWLPFFNQDMVELPLTMPQDHTLFTILRRRDESAWIDKAEFLRSRGGMVLLDTHPDYLIEKRAFDAYRRLLERFAGDRDMWSALPREVSGWWRRRADSRLERSGSDWRLTGPAAAEARIELA